MARDLVTVRIPAQTRFISLARVTAAGAAAELDFSIDEVDDLRMAVNEIVALVQELAADAGAEYVDVRYRLAVDEIEMTAQLDGVATVPEVDELTRQILDAVVDEFATGPGSMTVRKRRDPR